MVGIYAMKKDRSYIVIIPEDGGIYYCKHCGTKKKASLPAGILEFVAEGEAFIQEHEGCVAAKQGEIFKN